MPNPKRTTCLRCGRHKFACGPISWGGLCTTCAEARFVANAVGLAERHGEFYDHWRRRNFMAARRLLLDDAGDGA